MRTRTRRIDWWEMFLIGFFIALLGFAIAQRDGGSTDSPEVQGVTASLEQRFGSHKNSQGPEEWLVREFFNDERNGVFLDVGASDYRSQSNTYYLETQLGWSGVAVDALPQFASGYARYRPRTRFVPAFVSDRPGNDMELFVGLTNTEVSSTDPTFTQQHTPDVTSVRVKTTTLDDILAQTRLTRIDFLSLDIELHEPKALVGFDIGKYRPRLVCVEAHPQVRQALLDYFQMTGYVIVGRYLRVDSLNLWFRPATVS